MSLLARIKRKLSRTLSARVPELPGPPFSDAQVTVAYQILSGGRARANRVAALCEQNSRSRWNAQGLLFNFLAEQDVADSLNLPEIARAMYESRAVLPLNTHFGSVIYGYPCDQFVYGTIKRTGVWEPHVEAFLRRWCVPGSVAVDVGANCGYFSALLCNLVGASGEVHAFEPGAHLVTALEKTRDANGYAQLRIHHAAAGEAPAERVTLHVDLVNAGGNQILPAGFRVPTNSRFALGECPVVTLDDVLRDRSKPVGVMKVDVEGFELSVLRGARDIVRRDRPALCLEFAPDNMVRKGADPTELVQMLLDAGYDFAFHDRPAPAGLTAAQFCDHVSREYVWAEVFATPRAAS